MDFLSIFVSSFRECGFYTFVLFLDSCTWCLKLAKVQNTFLFDSMRHKNRVFHNCSKVINSGSDIYSPTKGACGGILNSIFAFWLTTLKPLYHCPVITIAKNTDVFLVLIRLHLKGNKWLAMNIHVWQQRLWEFYEHSIGSSMWNQGKQRFVQWLGEEQRGITFFCSWPFLEYCRPVGYPESKKKHL